MIASGGGGRGFTPLYKPYSVCAVLKGRVLALFWSEIGRDFAHFGVESDMVFKGTTGEYERIYPFNSKWVTKKEKCAN